MTKRVPASMRPRETLSARIEGRLSSQDGRSEVVRLAARLTPEEAPEAETRDALGRDEDESGAEEGRGCRNGRRTGRLKTAEGAMEVSAPQVAGRDEPFRSEIREHAKARSSRPYRSARQRAGLCRLRPFAPVVQGLRGATDLRCDRQTARQRDPC